MRGPWAGWCVARAATRAGRTPTSIRSPWRPCAKRSSRRPPRSWATRVSRSSISPTAPWPTISRSASCWSARSGRSAPTRCSRPIPTSSSTATAASTTPTIGPRASRRSMRCTRRRGTRWPSRGSPARGWPRTTSGACTSSGPTSRTSGSTSAPRSTGRSRALRAHGSQIKHPERLEERIRAWAKEEGESVGVEAAEALRAVVIDEDEDDAEGPTHTDEAPSEAPGPTHEHAATAARSPDTTT